MEMPATGLERPLGVSALGDVSRVRAHLGRRAALVILGLTLVLSACIPRPMPGDLDGDGDVDQHDLNIILAALNTPASGSDDARDLDGDGMITGLDARKLVLLCTLPGCAIPPEVSITSPENRSIFNTSPITVSGEISDTVEEVTVNGVPASLNALTWTAEVPLQEGNNILAAIARDAGGNESTASIEVELDTTPPALAITSPGEGDVVAEGQPSIAVSYSDQNGVDTTSLVFGANGSALAVDCTLGETSGSCTPTGFLPTGPVTLVATIADSVGNVASAQVRFSVGAAPLAITITEPAEGAVFGASPITVRGDVSDPTAAVMVGDVFATVSGTTFEATAVVITEGPNTLIARTRDDARDEAVATRSVILDTRPPILSILSPADRSVLLEASAVVSGYVSDATELTATINGEPASIFESELTGTATLGSNQNLVTVVCRDAAGNTTTEMLTLYVDAVPLAVTDIAPSDGALDVAPSTAITATFAEPVNPASLTASSFFVVQAIEAGSSILPATLTVAADGLSATLIPSRALPAGASIEISVTTGATDEAGNPLPTPFRSSFAIAGVPAEPGVVIGEVYDDTRSLPLEGASVAALDPVSRIVLGQTETDERGRYLLAPGRSDVVIRVTKPGFTVVERTAVTRRGSFAEALDARLTPLGEAQAVASVLPAEIGNSEGDILEILPGAFDADGEVSLTPISQQGPRTPFPAGWTPLAIVDITAPEAFDPPATLSMVDRSGLAAGRQAVTARYDPASASWLALANVTIPEEGSVEFGEVIEAGQFALLFPDTGDGAPAAAVPGAALAAGSPIPIPEDADGTGVVTPPVGLISDPTPAGADVTITADTPLRSSTALLGDFLELFVLRDGGQLTPLSNSQDLFVYRSLDDPTGQTLTASFAIAPSMVFSPLEASEGSITVTLRKRSPIVREIVGIAGGGVQTSDASRVIVPPDALVGDVPIHLARVAEQDFGVDTPEDLTFLGGLKLDLAGATAAIELSLSLGDRASFVPTGAQVVVARIETVRGQARLVPVALARIDGDELTTFSEIGGASLPGVRAGGRYGFYLLSGPVEIVQGSARDQTGNLEGLIVRVDEMPFVSVTDADGRFALVSPPGNFTLVATSASTLDQARVDGTTGVPLAEVIVSTTPPFVERITLRPPRVEGNFTGPVVLLGKPAPLIDDDSSGASSGNDNGEIEAGERIELTLTVRNEGNVAIEGGFFVLDVRAAAGVVNVTPERLPIDSLAPETPVALEPFVFEIPAASDPSAFRYTLSRFTDDGGRPNDMFFALPLGAEHVNVPVDSEVTVEFSEPIEAASLSGALTLALDDGSGFVPIPAKLLVASDASAATLRPLELLEDDALYRVTLSDLIVDRDGHALARAPVVERIRTQDLTPPAAIDPGKIEASVPDDEGFVTVTGTLGSVNPGDTVIVFNERTGYVVVATVAADGSFIARIPAETTERLQIISHDQNGNETTIDVSGFVRRDPVTGEILSVVVGRDGATVEGPDGIELTVPTGAVQGAAEISVSRSDVPFALPDDIAGDPEAVAAFNALFTVVDRIQIDADIQQFAAPLALSLPAPIGAQEGDLFIVVRTQEVTIGGPLADLDQNTGLTVADNPFRTVDRLEILDSATVKSEGSSLVLSTDSPPFPGITQAGAVTVLEPAAPLTFLAGEVRRDTIVGSPVVGAVVQSKVGALATSAFAAVTDDEGQFIVADGGGGGPYAEGAVVASGLDVFDPSFARTIRRNVRAVVGPPAPASTVVAHLKQPFTLPTNLPAAVIDVLGDLEPPRVQLFLAGSSLGNGYAAWGDMLTILVAAQDNDEITFVSLQLDQGSGLVTVPLGPDGSFAFTPDPGLFTFHAQAQDRTGNTTFADKNVQVITLDAQGAPTPPPSDPDRAPTIILPADPAEPTPGEPAPVPVIPDANQISFDGDIVFLFSEPLDPTTVNEDSVEVLDPELVPIPVDITTEFGDSAIRIIPKRNLRLGARYEAHLSSGVQDLDGQSLPETRLKWTCPGPEQVATIDLPNATDVALLDDVEIVDEETGKKILLEDVVVAVNFPLGSDEPGAIQTYETRDREDPDLFLEKPRLLGSATTRGNPWSLAVDGDRAYVGNAWKGAIVFLEGSLSYTTELYGIYLGVFHEGRQANVGYQWSDELPNPPSNLEVFDLSDPRSPAQLGSHLANYGRLFGARGVTPLWDPNVLPTRVEVTGQGIAVLSHLDNIEIFERDAPFRSTGVLESIWGPGVRAGRCEGGPEEGQMCPVNSNPPFWPCLGDNECSPTDEFYDAVYFDASDSHSAFALVLQRDQQGAGARIIATDNLGDPLTFDNTIATLPIPVDARSHFGRVGAVPEFEWEETDLDTGEVTTHVSDLAFVATPGDRILRIFDVTDPGSPAELTSLETRLLDTFGNISFDTCSGLAYLKGVDGEFHIVDFNDPKEPIELNDPGLGRDPFRVHGVGPTVSFNGNTNDDHVVYLAEEGGIAVVQARYCTAAEAVSTSGPLPLASAATAIPSAAAASADGADEEKWRCDFRAIYVSEKPLRAQCNPLDLDIIGLHMDADEPDEIDVGGIVLLNNGGGVEEAGLVALRLDIEDKAEVFEALLSGELTDFELRLRPRPGAERIALYKWDYLDGTQTPIDLRTSEGERIGLEDLPLNLLVEGLEISEGLRDVRIEATLRVVAGTKTKNFRDRIRLTVAEIVLEPITAERTQGIIPNPSGVVDGGTAMFKVDVSPTMSNADIRWTAEGEGDVIFLGSFGTGTTVNEGRGAKVTVVGDGEGEVTLTVNVLKFNQQLRAELQYAPIQDRVPQIQTQVLEHTEIGLDISVVCDRKVSGIYEDCALGCNPICSEATMSNEVRAILDGINEIYEQVGVFFYPRTLRPWVKPCLLNPTIAHLKGWEEGCSNTTNTFFGRELIFVESISGGARGWSPEVGASESYIETKDIETKFVSSTSAHELGHQLGWEDIYHGEPNPDDSSDFSGVIEGPIKKTRVPFDWNNGPGTQFYQSNVPYEAYLKRLLMCGSSATVCDPDTADIPNGPVEGWQKGRNYDDDATGGSREPDVKVGRSQMDRSIGYPVQRASDLDH